MFNIQIPHDFYYIAFALGMVVFMVIFIPRSDIKELFPLSFVWGYLGSFLFVITFSGLLSYFRWQATPFTFISSPLILNLSWIPALMIYLYFLPKEKHLFWLYLLTFSLVSAGIDSVFHQLGTLRYIFWGPMGRFIVAVLWFLGVTVHFNYLTKKKLKLV